ncbi:hypothetical protein GEV33_006307 [Tenebrio molitor]|uniref:Nuclease HARBI1 n=1 Tax=Tenebrio molitor TaxID=7067 RepID=A0A8J6HKT5_TENMO|nr:hypothetical protein GEV33_006307 [Tenebrio molitor]
MVPTVKAKKKVNNRDQIFKKLVVVFWSMELQEFDSSSSSSDEELFELVGAVQPARVFRERKSPFEMYSEAEFRSRYRFYKNTVGTIIDLVEDHISPMTLRTRSLSAAEQLLIALRFYATGAFQILVGDDYGVHKTTAVLHNIAINENDGADDFDLIQDYENVEEEVNHDAGAGGNAALGLNTFLQCALYVYAFDSRLIYQQEFQEMELEVDFNHWFALLLLQYLTVL